MELVRTLRSLGIGLIAYNLLHAGLLAGALEAVETGAASSDLQQRVQPIRSQLAAYEALCRETARSPPTLRWRGCCATPWCRLRSSERARSSSCKPTSPAWRCTSSRTSCSGSTTSGAVQEKHRRHTPGEAPLDHGGSLAPATR